MAAFLGAIFPDFDLLYFYSIDQRQHGHHSYFTHYPVVWILGLLATGLWLRLNVRSRWAALAFVFCVGGFSHMVLDSLIGDIWWLAPWSPKAYSLFHVAPVFRPWWLNFVVSWVSILEILIVAWAWRVYKKTGPETTGNR